MSRFARLPEALIYDENISDSSLRCWAVVYRMCSGKDFIECGRDDIAATWGKSAATVKRALLELERTGWLVIERKSGLRSRFTPMSERMEDGSDLTRPSDVEVGSDVTRLPGSEMTRPAVRCDPTPGSEMTRVTSSRESEREVAADARSRAHARDLPTPIANLAATLTAAGVVVTWQLDDTETTELLGLLLVHGPDVLATWAANAHASSPAHSVRAFLFGWRRLVPAQSTGAAAPGSEKPNNECSIHVGAPMVRDFADQWQCQGCELDARIGDR